MAKVTERYFYTTHTPHEWSSGPSLSYLDPDNGFAPIENIERARELARAKRKGRWGEAGCVETTYGVYFEEEWDDE